MTARSAGQVRRYLQRHAQMAGWVAAACDDDNAPWLVVSDRRVTVIALCLGTQDAQTALSECVAQAKLARHPGANAAAACRSWSDLTALVERARLTSGQTEAAA